MALSQQQQIIDTIFSMKRRLMRPEDCMQKSVHTSKRLLKPPASDSEESETPPYSTQKQNLKRKTQYSRTGDPDFLSDPRPYKKVRSLAPRVCRWQELR